LLFYWYSSIFITAIKVAFMDEKRII